MLSMLRLKYLLLFFVCLPSMAFPQIVGGGLFANFEIDSERQDVAPLYSDRRTNPDYKSLRLWGLEIIDYPRWTTFAEGRVFYCEVINGDATSAVADCYAAPDRDSADLAAGSVSDWIPLVVWLPEFGIAKRSCVPSDEILVSSGPHFPEYSYACGLIDQPIKGLPLGEYVTGSE